jgi:hypothetical protein
MEKRGRLKLSTIEDVVGLGRRAQKEMSLGFLLAIILGAVVLVVLILFFTGFFDKIGGGVDQLPGNLEAIAQSCRISVQASLIADYCYNFKDVGDGVYINCEDPRIRNALLQQEVDVESITCDDNLERDAAEDTCKGLDSSDFNDARVGEVDCNTLSCSDLGGTVLPGPATACDTGERRINLGDVVCCIS